jgi:hypothetical protein
MNDATTFSDRPLSVTLTVSQWEIVLRAMHEVPLPYRVSGPLIAQMLHQLNSAPPPAPPDVAPEPQVTTPEDPQPL